MLLFETIQILFKGGEKSKGGSEIRLMKMYRNVENDKRVSE